ncbi:transglycosylase SLT domain-containing protein [Bacillus shivajii]|uniref:lytic transglycosylase domain-containing protein n=1 Tax=Bacillus shivajii TaxID=1983719 RepID=UPI001CFBD127|nr:transglycosylase SLT domain-containing protein [Bacillus shivajii]UCZ54527.1 transglycosylase SLT domain-containing protein [Bacillus shivajii]
MKLLKVLFLLLTILILGGATFYTGNEYVKMKEKVEELESEKEEQLAEQQLELEIHQMKTYIDHIPEGYDVSGYDTWLHAKHVADYLYEDSEGRFDRNWGKFLALEAERKGIDPFLVYELLKVETGGMFDPETVGPETKYGHAYGLAQFMKNTGPWIAEMAGLPYDDEMLFDPYYSIQLSVTYLDFLYKEYEDWDYALTAYHRGMYGLEAYIEENGHAASWYAVEIQENAEQASLVAVE